MVHAIGDRDQGADAGSDDAERPMVARSLDFARDQLIAAAVSAS